MCFKSPIISSACVSFLQYTIPIPNLSAVGPLPEFMNDRNPEKMAVSDRKNI